MGKLLRSDRREINQRIIGLEEMNLAGETAETIQKRLDELYAMMSAASVPDNSDYYNRINAFIQRAEAGLHLAPTPILSEEDFRKPKREYMGFTKHLLKIVADCDCLILSRTYPSPEKNNPKKLRVGWEFNREGRLDLIEMLVFPERILEGVVRVDDKSLPKNWNSTSAARRPLPDLVCLINHGFSRWPAEVQYQDLLKYGHSEIYSLAKDLESGKVKDAHDLFGEQKQLREIVNDNAAMHIILGAAAIFPSARLLTDRRLTIEYRPR